MKIGLSTYSLHRAIESGEMSVLQAIRWIAENGGEHVELHPSGFTLLGNDALVKEAVRAAREAGVDIASYTIGADLTPRAEREIRAEVEKLKRQVDVGHALGVKLMRHDVVSRRDPETTLEQFERDLPTAVDACREVADYAARFGITTGLENHGHHFQGSDRMVRMIAAVDRPNFRLTMDVGNFCHADEEPLDAVRRVVSLACYIHVKDNYLRRFDRDPGEGWSRSRSGNYIRGAIVGHGDMDMRAIVSVIRSSGYDGYLTVEFEGMEECKLGSRIGLSNLRRYVQESSGTSR